jgi:hypothetical protein
MLQSSPETFEVSKAGRFRVDSYFKVREGVVSFDVPRRDPTKKLVIDPVLNFAARIGGSGVDLVRGMRVDASGNIYIAGDTDSTELRLPWSPSGRGGRNGWIMKLDPAGTQVLYRVFIEGTGQDSVNAIAIDAYGNVYATGSTSSNGLSGFSGGISGLEDAFVMKLNSSGHLQYARYIGGESADVAWSIDVAGTGVAVVAGQTSSRTMPTTAFVSYPSYRGGASDCFAGRISAAGAIEWLTYYGGSGLDICRAIAFDSSGNSYVTGATESLDLPLLNALQTTNAGATDILVARFSAAGVLAYSTYLGGVSLDDALGLGIDSAGGIWIGGTTASGDFPVMDDAVQATISGSYDGFVTRIAPDGRALTYSTFLGGSGEDAIAAISCGTNGRVAIAGFTTSTDLRTRDAVMGFAGNYDAFAAVLNTGLREPEFLSYFGGAGEDRATGVQFCGTGRLCIAGWTASSSLLSTPAPSATTHDGFVANVSYSARTKLIPITPCRVMDTRSASFIAGLGVPYLQARAQRDVPLPLSQCGVPANAVAYSLNITVVPYGFLNYLTVWPTGKPRPTASTLNSWDGRVVANAAIIPAGTNGYISVYASENTEVLIDINGYFASLTGGAGSDFRPLTPCRVVDTRSGGPPFGGPFLAGNSQRTLPLPSSSCGIPGDATAYSLNITAVPHGFLNYLTVWPAGQPKPTVSTLNSWTGAVVANAAIVPAGSGSGISVFASNNTDLIIDVNGYFTLRDQQGYQFYSVSPCRISDTRDPNRPTPFGTPVLSAASQREIPIPLSECGVGAGSAAYWLNLTVVPSGFLNYLTVWPAGVAKPVVSTLNSWTGTVVANGALVPAGMNGAISVFVSEGTQLIVDANGYFAP